MMDEETRNTIASWRSARTASYALRCGLVVTLRKIGLLELAAQGQIPTPLYGQVQAFLNRERGESIKIEVGNFREWADTVNLIVMASVVSPPIGYEASDDTIGINEIPVDDRLVIFGWAQQEVAPSARFLG